MGAQSRADTRRPVSERENSMAVLLNQERWLRENTSIEKARVVLLTLRDEVKVTYLLNNVYKAERFDSFSAMRYWALENFPLDSHKPQTQEQKHMHNSNLILLVDESMRVIKAQYEPKGKSEYFKTRDANIAVDDYIVTQTHSRHEMTVAKVTAVDVNPDLDTVGEIRWAVQRIDYETYQADCAAEATMIDRIQEKKRAEKRAELRKTMVGDFGENPAATLLAAPVVDPADNDKAVDSNPL